MKTTIGEIEFKQIKNENEMEKKAANRYEVITNSGHRCVVEADQRRIESEGSYTSMNFYLNGELEASYAAQSVESVRKVKQIETR